MKEILKVFGKYVVIVVEAGMGICVAADAVKKYIDGNA